MEEGGVTNRKLIIRNFKSIHNQELDLAPITIIYGPNGSGKSSVIQALLALKNVCLNPSQASGGFFNYGYTNLGGFQAVVSNHQITNPIEIGISYDVAEAHVEYTVQIHDNQGRFLLKIHDGDESVEVFELKVTFPYPLNQPVKKQIKRGAVGFSLSWNGVTASAETATITPEALSAANAYLMIVNGVAAQLQSIAVAPPVRAFTEPQYTVTAVSPLPVKPEEVATLLSQDPYLEQQVSNYLELIVDRDLRVRMKPATSFFTLHITDRKAVMGADLANDGSGIGQLVYLLARTLAEGTGRICIEEPELHLHPTAVRRLARTIVRILKEEQKRFLVNTQSEGFILAVLSLVSSGELSPKDLAIYLAKKEKRITTFQLQSVNEKGQIEGGLADLVEAELEDIKTFLAARPVGETRTS
jgi:predicted ATPase